MPHVEGWSSLKQILHNLSTQFLCIQGALDICQIGKLQRLKSLENV